MILKKVERVAKTIWKETRPYRDREFDFVLKWKDVKQREKDDYYAIAKKVIQLLNQMPKGKV